MSCREPTATDGVMGMSRHDRQVDASAGVVHHHEASRTHARPRRHVPTCRARRGARTGATFDDEVSTGGRRATAVSRHRRIAARACRAVYTRVQGHLRRLIDLIDEGLAELDALVGAGVDAVDWASLMDSEDEP